MFLQKSKVNLAHFCPLFALETVAKCEPPRVARWFVFKLKNPNFGKIWFGLGMETVVIFYEYLEYFTAIRYNLLTFGIVCCHFGIFITFWYVSSKKNLATL
jgi:hypothetical protein